MAQPLEPERAKEIAGRIKDLSGKVGAAGQKAAGEAIRGSDLPFENNSTGRRVATIPTPDGGTAGISYDPASPPESDFGFSARDPQGNPRDIPGVPGMKGGEATLKPLDVGPAIEKATDMDTAKLIVHFGLDLGQGGREP
jgi:hypothetical protein